MTRQECEDRVIGLLEEVRAVMMDFGLERLNTSVCKNLVCVYAFELNEDGSAKVEYDKDGNFVHADMVLDKVKYFGGEEFA